MSLSLLPGWVFILISTKKCLSGNLLPFHARFYLGRILLWMSYNMLFFSIALFKLKISKIFKKYITYVREISPFYRGREIDTEKMKLTFQKKFLCSVASVSHVEHQRCDFSEVLSTHNMIEIILNHGGAMPQKTVHCQIGYPKIALPKSKEDFWKCDYVLPRIKEQVISEAKSEPRYSDFHSPVIVTRCAAVHMDYWWGIYRSLNSLLVWCLFCEYVFHF